MTAIFAFLASVVSAGVGAGLWTWLEQPGFQVSPFVDGMLVPVIVGLILIALIFLLFTINELDSDI